MGSGFGVKVRVLVEAGVGLRVGVGVGLRVGLRVRVLGVDTLALCMLPRAANDGAALRAVTPALQRNVDRVGVRVRVRVMVRVGSGLWGWPHLCSSSLGPIAAPLTQA